MRTYRLLCALTCGASVAALAGTSAEAESVYLLQDVGTTQQLALIDSNTPGNITIVGPISGLDMGVGLLGIDFRPATGQLYGLGSDDAIFTIDTATGASSKVGTGFTDSLVGSSFGFDFNPVIDRIRIVSDSNTNFVAHPDTGDANVATTTDVFFVAGDANEGADPNVVSSAYTNSFPGGSTPEQGTQLYGVDTDLDILVTQANNAGTLATVGELGFDIADATGFDISGTTGTALLAGIKAGETNASLFEIDLATGAATELGMIGPGTNGTFPGLAIAPGDVDGPNGPDDPEAIPSPAALPAGVLLLAGLVGRRRRRSA